GGISAGALGVEGVNVMTSELASRAVGAIDEAIDSIVKQRTQIVSYSTALEHTAANLASSGANLTQARSRITDADEAKSTMRFIEFQILSHGQELIIASANQQPEAVYSLLNTET
ncbi:MAG: flagellin, partial [Synergistaceae bacterium]|nr:flagellin [Synergistaceae bacterium]